MTTGWDISDAKESETNFNWASKQGFLVSLSQSGTISTNRWEIFLQEILTKEITHALVISIGSATINSVQRKSVADAVKEKNIRVAVILDSAVTRGLITAISWLGVQIKSFGPGAEAEALDYLDTPGLPSSEILEMLHTLETVTRPKKG